MSAACWVTKANKHTLRTRNTFCSSTTKTTVTRKRLNVALYVLCPSVQPAPCHVLCSLPNASGPLKGKVVTPAIRLLSGKVWRLMVCRATPTTDESDASIYGHTVKVGSSESIFILDSAMVLPVSS